MLDQSRYETINIQREGRVTILTLNRPERLNAISARMHTELSTVFRDLDEDEETRVAVLTGAGRGFCSGGDFKADSRLNRNQDQTQFEARIIIDTLIDLRKPIISAVNGPAAGLGANIAVMCDWVIASESARIGDTHVNMGLTAGDGGAVIWPLLVGVNRAKYCLMTGELLSAHDAHQMGLVNQVVADGDLLKEAMRVAQRLANGPSYAIQTTKTSINKILRFYSNLVLPTSLAVEWVSSTRRDHTEAVKAFQERRPPKFE
jgi:enoyl-CoA hydratase